MAFCVDGVAGVGPWTGTTTPARKRVKTSMVISCAEEDAFRLASSVAQRSGLEAYRQPKRRYEPKTAGTKRALLKSTENNQEARKLQKVVGT